MSMSTLSDGLRQSDRVSFRMPLEASWVTPDGRTQTATAETLLVSRNGGVIRLTEKLAMGQDLHLRRNLEGDMWKSARARVVAEIDQDPPNHFLYAIHLVDPRSEFWDIEFPALHKSEEALARLLMECSFCQRREVVYLNAQARESYLGFVQGGEFDVPEFGARVDEVDGIKKMIGRVLIDFGDDASAGAFPHVALEIAAEVEILAHGKFFGEADDAAVAADEQRFGSCGLRTAVGSDPGSFQGHAEADAVTLP